MLPLHFIQYYYNLYTTETTWDLPELDSQKDGDAADDGSPQLEHSSSEACPAPGSMDAMDKEQRGLVSVAILPAQSEDLNLTEEVAELPVVEVEPVPNVEVECLTPSSPAEIAPVTELRKAKPQKPPKALALLVAKSIVKSGDIVSGAASEVHVDDSTAVVAEPHTTAAPPTNDEQDNSGENDDASHAASAVVSNTVQCSAASQEVLNDEAETIKTSGDTGTSTASPEPSALGVLVQETNESALNETVVPAEENLVLASTEELEQTEPIIEETRPESSPSALHTRVTSTGKVSALAKMFSRPSSNNNMKSTDPVSPQNSDASSPAKSPSSAKNAGLWGPSVRNKSTFASKSSSATGSVLFMTPTSSKTQSKRTVSQEHAESLNERPTATLSPTVDKDDQDASPETVTATTAASSIEECDTTKQDALPSESGEEKSTQVASFTNNETADTEVNESSKVPVAPTEAAKAKRQRPPPPPPPPEPFPEKKEHEASEGETSIVNHVPASEVLTEVPLRSDPDEGNAASHAAQMETISSECAQDTVAEAVAAPTLQRAVSAPVEAYVEESPSGVSKSSSASVPAPPPVVRSASVPENVVLKVKPPKPPKNISAKVNTSSSTSSVAPVVPEAKVAAESATETAVTGPVALPAVTATSDPLSETHGDRPLPAIPSIQTAVSSSDTVEHPPPVVCQASTGSPARYDAIPPPPPPPPKVVEAAPPAVEIAEEAVEEAVAEAAKTSNNANEATNSTVHSNIVPTSKRAKPGLYQDSADSDSDYGEIELEILPSHEHDETDVEGVSKTVQSDAVSLEHVEVEAKLDVETPVTTEPEPVHSVAPVASAAAEKERKVKEDSPREVQPVPAISTVSVEAPSSNITPTPKTPTVVKPPKPAKRVPPPSSVATPAVLPVLSAHADVAQPVFSKDPQSTSTTSENKTASEIDSAAELAARPLPPPPPPPPRVVDTAAITPHIVTTMSEEFHHQKSHENVNEEPPLPSKETAPHMADATLSAELAALKIDIEDFDHGESASDASSVYPEGHIAELKAALDAIEILTGEIEMVETEGMNAEDEYSSNREKHESLHLPPPPSLSPPPPPPAHLKGNTSGAQASAVVNPFEEDETEDSGDEKAIKNNHFVAGVKGPAVTDNVHSAQPVPGAGKIGAGRSMGTWHSTTASADASSNGTRPAPLPVQASGKRAIGQWDQSAASPTVSDPPVQKVSAFGAPPATNAPPIPTARAMSPYVPAPAQTPVAVAVNGEHTMGTRNTSASPMNLPSSEANPRYTHHKAASHSGATSRETSPGPTRQMSPLLAIALSKKAEAARTRSPPPMQTTSRNSSINDFSHHDDDFAGFDGGRASDVHSLVGYKGVPITHSHSSHTAFGGASAVGGSMGSNYSTPEGSTRDDAPQSFMQRTGTGQVRKRNPRPSEVLTGPDEGMEALNSIVLKK